MNVMHMTIVKQSIPSLTKRNLFRLILVGNVIAVVINIIADQELRLLENLLVIITRAPIIGFIVGPYFYRRSKARRESVFNEFVRSEKNASYEVVEVEPAYRTSYWLFGSTMPRVARRVNGTRIFVYCAYQPSRSFSAQVVRRVGLFGWWAIPAAAGVSTPTLLSKAL